MHDPSKTGPESFVCDFCLRSWREDLPMVEGHRGSLICAECLARALAELEVSPVPRERVTICVMCQEHRDEPYWANEASDALICLRCAVKSAGVLEKDAARGEAEADHDHDHGEEEDHHGAHGEDRD